MGIEQSRYLYLENLLALDRCCPLHPAASWDLGSNPFLDTALLPFITRHRDQVFAAFVFNGITRGFRIGNDQSFRLRSAGKNHQRPYL
jgi:hypothetical protein